MREIFVGKGKTPKLMFGEHLNHDVLQNLISSFFRQGDTQAILVKLLVAVLDNFFWGSFDKDSNAVIVALLIIFSGSIIDCDQ